MKENYYEGEAYIKGFLMYNTTPTILHNKYAYNDGSKNCSRYGGWHHEKNVLRVNNQDIAIFGNFHEKPFVLIRTVIGGSAKRKVISVRHFVEEAGIPYFIVIPELFSTHHDFTCDNLESIIKDMENVIQSWIVQGLYAWKKNRVLLIEGLVSLINFYDLGFTDMVGSVFFSIDMMRQLLISLQDDEWCKVGRAVNKGFKNSCKGDLEILDDDTSIS